MTESGTFNSDPHFQPRADADAAGSDDLDAVGTNAIRALLLGLMLSDAQEALFGLEGQLEVVGLERGVPAVSGWDHRLETAARADSLLRNLDVPLSLGPRGESPSRDYSSERTYLWVNARNSPTDPAASIAWLRTVMYSAPHRVDGVAAAAALSHWRRPKGATEVPGFLRDAREVLNRAARGDDAAAREVALAARRTGLARPGSAAEEDSEATRWKATPAQCSVTIHGTWAWRGDWWYPGGDFHSFVAKSVRPNLYAGGAPFSWSGGYFTKSRKKAAQRLARWSADIAGSQLDTAFAHSYGGGIALMSTTSGASYDRLILLSVPVHNDYDIEWRKIGKAQSVRLSFDLVLAAARARQRFGANVDELVLPLYPWSHGATHDPALWTKESIQQSLGL